MSELDRPVIIHVCKDRTLSFRTKDEPVFNGVALPVFSVDTRAEAEMLVTAVGSLQYEEHPQLPGKPWRKISVEFKQHLELDDLPYVAAKLRDVYTRMKER